MATHSILNSSFPVFLPHYLELHLSDAEFVRELDKLNNILKKSKVDGKDSNKSASRSEETLVATEESPFIKALHASEYRHYESLSTSLAAKNKTFTENVDITHISSQDSLVDLFYKLSDDAVDPDLLKDAWATDSLATLKIIFNARSIHLGKSNRVAAYKAFGWLYKEHPMTLLANLPWLVRPVIPKPSLQKDSDRSADDKDVVEKDLKESVANEDNDFVIINPPKGATYDTDALDREHGMAHGYWKDLLNILVLAAEDHFDPVSDPKDVLNIKDGQILGKRRSRATGRSERPAKTKIWDHDKAKEFRTRKRTEQHEKILQKLEENRIYRALHISVARLFAEQLKRDLVLLNSTDKNAKNRISLAAKWAPSLKESHDRHTFIATSIAEILFTHEEVCPAETPKLDRETYLKHARAALQFRVLSPLRKAIDIVERHITEKSFSEIQYEKVPSLAMQRYNKLFIDKDENHFMQYLDHVASGSKKISGAVLLPANLVQKAQQMIHRGGMHARAEQTEQRVLDLQWKTLVQRIKDSGKIESSIAVCDVSGSMAGPKRADGTTPMNSSIGLSLLLAEVCDPPFGGTFITFHEQPKVIKVGGPGDKRTFCEKVKLVMESKWGMSTNFVSVFKDLILFAAKKHKLKQEDMVKQVFVFSDMQFNHAQRTEDAWSTSFERIQQAYRAAGYEMPTLVFWNLASYDKGVPVTSLEPGTALLSGYSQAQMKVFLDGGGFEEPEEEDDEVLIDSKGSEVTTEKDRKTDPTLVMRKAISHQGYAMLRVVD